MNILELKVDCCEELFEWLTLSDLKSLRQTCKRLKKIVDYYIQSIYPKGFGRLNIYDDDQQPKDLCGFDSSFSQLYKHIYITYSNPITCKLIENIKPILSSVFK